MAAATIVENLGNGSISTGVGVTSMVLGWFGFALLIIVTIGLLVMCVHPVLMYFNHADRLENRILSMQLVEQLTDLEDDDD